MESGAMTAQRLRLARHLRLETVPDEAEYLVSERDLLVLENETARAVAPLLDGRFDLDGVMDATAGRAAPERVAFFVHELVRQRRAAASGPAAATEPREGAFWEMAGLDGDGATAAARGTVRLVVVGDVPYAQSAAALTADGLVVTDDPSSPAGLTIVLTDDYLRPALGDLNAFQLASGAPWLLAKPFGSIVWVGPVFRPGGACLACLTQRLGRHRQGLAYLEQRLGLPSPLIPPIADLPATRAFGLHLVAAEAAKWLAGYRHPHQGDVVTTDTLAAETTRHRLTRRPQCPVCGDAGLTATGMRAPIVLQPRPKAFTADGGHRATRPESLLEKYGHLVSPVSGVVSELRRFDGVPGAEETGEFVKCYVAGSNIARGAPNLRTLRAGMRSQSSGKGMTDVQARASALGEAVERYCGLFQGDEPRITASYEELGPDAIHPNALHLYSDRQFERRQAANENVDANGFTFVADPLDPQEPIEWTPVWSLSRECHRYVPTAYLFYHYPLVPGRTYAWADSNGNAAGASVEDAVLQGFLELVERDSVAMWWYHRLRRPAVDLDSFPDPWIARFRAFYAEQHREMWVLDLTADFGIPAMAAVSYRTDKPQQDILMAFGAHFDPQIALLRALTEMNQFLTAVAGARADGGGYSYLDEFQLGWWRGAKIADYPYLVPDAGLGTRTRASYTDASGPDLCQDVQTARRLVEERGMELLVLDQTRPDIGLPVVKVIVPGMRHFWTRFAPGRLYDVPVALGWLSEPTAEEGLNPLPMFL